TSTSTLTLGSTTASASTARMALKKLAPEPPYCSGISMPISPSSKRPGNRDLSRTAASSIAATWGWMRFLANSRTESRKNVSSSESMVSAGWDTESTSLAQILGGSSAARQPEPSSSARSSASLGAMPFKTISTPKKLSSLDDEVRAGAYLLNP